MEDINALDEIHKGCCMGIDAIDYTLDKVEDNDLKKELQKEKKNYEVIKKKIEKIYPNYNEGKPHATNIVTKTMTKMGVDMKTLTDKSNSKISELILQGINMGIIEGRKILNNKKINSEVETLLDNYVKMQEESVEILKKYL